MTLLYMEGFELGTLVSGWSAFSDQGFQAGIWGGTEFYFGSGSAGVERYGMYDPPTGHYLSSGYVGVRLRTIGVPVNGQFFQLQEKDVVAHLALRRNGAGKIELVCGGTVLGTTVDSFDITITHHYGIKYVIADGTGGSATVQIDGKQVINVTGVDTRNGGTTGLISRYFWTTAASGGVFVFLDDFYMGNLSGDAPYNTLLGDCRVETLLPNGNGDSSQWVGSDGNSTDNYALVDDTNPADNVVGNSDGHRDLYAVANTTAANGDILATQVSVLAARNGAETAFAGIDVVQKGDGGGVVVDPVVTAANLLSSYQWFVAPVKTTDPDGDALTLTNLNGLQVGVEVNE